MDLHLQTLTELATGLTNREFTSVVDLRPGKPEVRLTLTPGALGLGLNARSVAGQLRAAFFGTTAREMQIGRESIEVDVRLDDEDRSHLSGLDNFRIALPNGELVPLPVVVKTERSRAYARIARVDGRRTVTIRGDVDRDKANVEELLAAMHRDYIPSFNKTHPGVEVSLEGESAESRETNNSIMGAFLLGLLGVFVLLSFQFRSWIEPLVVMVAFPWR